MFMDKFRQKFTFFHVERDVKEILEACKVADFVVFGYSSEEEVDEYGELILACVLAQGVPSVINVVVGSEQLPQKKKVEVKKALTSYIADFFPEDQKLFTLDSSADTLNFLRHIATAHTKSILWRDRHPYMVNTRLALSRFLDEAVVKSQNLLVDSLWIAWRASQGQKLLTL